MMHRHWPALLTLGLAWLPVVACRSSLGTTTPSASPTMHSPGPATVVDPEQHRPAPMAEGGTADLIRVAAAHNPRLAAARSRWLAARERPTQARALPDPMVTYTEMIEPVQTRVGPMARVLALRQAIPFPGKLTAAGDVATEQARIRELEYHIALRDTVADLKRSAAELSYLEQAVRIVDQNRVLATQLAEKAAAGYAAQAEPSRDTLTLFDTLKAQSSLAQLTYDRVTLVELRTAERATLNALLGRAPQSPLPTPALLRLRTLDAAPEDLYLLARTRRQEIQAAIHKVRAARHAERLARLSQVPDLTLGVQYTTIGAAGAAVRGSGDDAVGVQLGFSLPLWSAKNRARIDEARHLENAARQERRAAEDDVVARISKLYFRLQNAERLARLYGESLVPQAQDALRIAEQWHDTGRDTFGRLLEARMVWLNFRLAEQRALADYEQMVARLEQWVGVSLEHLRREGATR